MSPTVFIARPPPAAHRPCRPNLPRQDDEQQRDHRRVAVAVVVVVVLMLLTSQTADTQRWRRQHHRRFGLIELGRAVTTVTRAEARHAVPCQLHHYAWHDHGHAPAWMRMHSTIYPGGA
jgi:hypothetical protein